MKKIYLLAILALSALSFGQTNLLQQGGFEGSQTGNLSSATTPWSNDSSGTVTISAGTNLSGLRSVIMPAGFRVLRQHFTATAGKVYTLTYNIRYESATSTDGVIYGAIQNPTSSSASTPFSPGLTFDSPFSPAASGYVRYTYTFVAPQANLAFVIFKNGGSSAAARLDDISIVEGSSAPLSVSLGTGTNNTPQTSFPHLGAGNTVSPAISSLNSTATTFAYSGTNIIGTQTFPPINAGTFFVRATTTPVSGGKSTINVAFTITPIAAVLAGLPYAYTFNGSEQGPNALTPIPQGLGATTTIAYDYIGINPTVYGPSATRPTNAGSYSVTATVSGNTSNYTSTTSTATNFTIAKATPTISISNSPQTATDSPIAATVIATGDGIVNNILYNGSATVPSASGIYTITADIGASANYNSGTGLSAGSFVINNKFTPSITVTPIATAISFGQTLASSSLSGGAASVPGTFAFTTPTTAPNGGTNNQSVTFTPDDTTNNNIVTFAVSVLVNKATPTLSITGTPTAFTYTTLAQSPIVTVTNNSAGAQTLSYSSTDGGGYSSSTPPTNAGAYQVRVSVATTTNYLAAGPSNAVAFTIAKATPTVLTAPTSANTITYGQTTPNAGLNGGQARLGAVIVAGSFAYANLTFIPPAGTNARFVAFYPTDTANYNTSATVNVNVTVTPKALTITANNTSKTYGNLVTLTGTAFTTAGLVSGQTPPDTVTGVSLTSTGATAIAPVAGSPYGIVPSAAVGSGLSNYTITYTNGTLTVNRAVLTITAANQSVSYSTVPEAVTSAGTYTPTGFVNSETASVITGSATYTTTYTASTNFGTSGVTIAPVLTGLIASNYSFTPANGTITITKAASSVTVTGAEPFTYVYDGVAKTPAFTKTGSTNSLTYTYIGTGATSYSSASAPTDAGTYSVTATVATDANYNAATSGANAFTITPAGATITVTEGQNKVYGASNPTYTFTTSPTVTTSGALSRVAGETVASSPYAYTIGSLVSTDANYTLSLAAGTFAITKATPTVTLVVSNSPATYNGSAQSANAGVSASSVAGTVSSILSGESATQTNAGTYATTASFVPDDTDNYNTLIGLPAGNFVINSALLSITANNASKCFGDSYTLGNSAFTSSGLISPETIESVTLISTGADAGAAVATYSLVPSDATGATFLASNYAITYIDGTLTVDPTNTIGVASSTPTLCLSTALSEITHATTGATGIGTAINLPTGVTASWASNTITISGTPTTAGIFNYSIPLTGGCGSANATGTIIVNNIPATIASITASDVNLCKYIGTTNTITYTASPVAGAVSYSWTIPAQGVTIRGGQGTNALVVDFHTALTNSTTLIGYLEVKAINASGCESSVVPASSRRYLLPKVPYRPSLVNLTYNGVQILRVGNFVGDASKTLVLTATDNSGTATSYHWDLPVGVNVVSGNENRDKVISINLADVQPGLTDLEFSVYADAVCGSSLPTILEGRRDLPLAPSALALTDAAISTTTRITRATAYIGTTTPLTLIATPITVSGYESTSYKWVLPSGIAIVGASATLVSEDSGFKTYTSPSNVISINLSGVRAATSLLIRVYGVNGNGESLLSRNLTLTATVPAAPAALRLTNNTDTLAVTNVSTYIGTSTPLMLTATASVLATSYEWELPAGVNLVSGATTTSPGIASGISNVITVNFANVAGGTTSLYLGVKSVNGVGVSVTNNTTLVPSTSSTARLLRVNAAVPAAVNAVEGQIAGLCGGNSYSYTITPSVLATSYLITAPTGSVVTSLSNPTNATNVLSTSNLTFTVLYPVDFASTTAVGVKSIVIGSVNGVGSSLLNRTIALSTLIPAIGIVTSSTTGVTVFNQGLTAKVFTVPAILGATGYNWTVANGAVIVGARNANSITVNFSAVPTTIQRTIITVSATTPCGTTAVRTITLNFNSAATRLRQETIAINATDVYPNPASNYFNIEIAASKVGVLEITIYSLDGANVSSKSVQLKEGVNTINNDISSLSTGTYIVKLINSSNNEMITKKLIKK